MNVKKKTTTIEWIRSIGTLNKYHRGEETSLTGKTYRAYLDKNELNWLVHACTSDANFFFPTIHRMQIAICSQYLNAKNVHYIRAFEVDLNWIGEKWIARKTEIILYMRTCIAGRNEKVTLCTKKGSFNPIENCLWTIDRTRSTWI